VGTESRRRGAARLRAAPRGRGELRGRTGRLDYLVLALGNFTLAGIAALVLLSCNAGTRVTGPSSPETAEAAQANHALPWHGAKVTGHRAAELVPLLNKAAPAIIARWPGWAPVGWTIEGWAGRVPCAGAINGTATGCRGTTETYGRRIRISWTKGPADVVQVAAWEICNAARWDQTGELLDVGCR
jgi:hypothetical protein